MNYKLIKFISTFCVMPVATFAQAQTPVENRIEAAFKENDKGLDLSYLQSATVYEAGEELDMGDLIELKRGFGDWYMSCQIRPSKNLRICAVEQKKGEDVYTVQFRIAQNKEKKPVAIIVLPSFLKTDDGLRISFSGLEKTIEKDEFRCTPTFCISGFPFEGFVQSAITQSSRIGFSYTALGFNPSEEEKAIKITMKMDGYEQALNAAGTDPYGTVVSTKAAKEIATQIANEKTAADKVAKTKSVPSPKPKAVVRSAPAAEKKSVEVTKPNSTRGLY